MRKGDVYRPGQALPEPEYETATGRRLYTVRQIRAAYAQGAKDSRTLLTRCRNTLSHPTHWGADEIEQLRQDARDFAEQLTEKPEIIDFACAECLPDYTDVLPGFRCARHRAQAWLSAHPAENKE